MAKKLYEEIYMQWESMGFKDDPFKTQPITAYTLDLYTGNEDKISNSKFALNSNNIIMVVEGDRGVGTTSFGNLIRFSAQNDKKYFTPTSEIRVEPSWNADTLMAAVIVNIVTTLQLNYADKLKNNAKFKAAKAIVQQVTETYRSFGASVFGFGASFGSSTNSTQPMVMPTQVLAHHLEGLVQIVLKLGFKYGILIQLNNLDVGVVQDENNLKTVLNVMRDYFQLPGTSWMLVGDMSLRRFISQEVDRVDDIITYEVDITQLSKTSYLKLIENRIKYFRVNSKVSLPVDKEVLLYLHEITKGRLRYVFGLLSRLFNVLKLGVLADKVTMDLAKPVIISYAKDRINRFNLTVNEEMVLKVIVNKEGIQVTEISDLIGKKQSYISNILSQLQEYKLVGYIKKWRNHHYYASIDANILYNSQ